MSNIDTPTGDHPVDDVAAYALDALEDGERRAVDDHLAGCDGCRDELATHYETLALLAPEEAPPAAVWDRVAASIGTTPGGSGAGDDNGAGGRGDDGSGGVVRPLPPPAPPSAGPSGAVRPGRFGWLAAAATVAVALGVGGAVGYGMGRSGDDADIGTLAEQAAAQPDGELATLTAPDGAPVARLVADADGAYLVLEGLGNLPEGRAYQLWSLTEARPVSLGMLGRDGTNTVAFRLPPTITDVAITEAPTSGDAVPSGDFLASGSIVRT